MEIVIFNRGLFQNLGTYLYPSGRNPGWLAMIPAKLTPTQLARLMQQNSNYSVMAESGQTSGQTSRQTPSPSSD
jgi:hypothetical protein